MGIEQRNLGPTSVVGELNYLRDDGVRPVNYTWPQPEGQPQRTGTLQPIRVDIHNARRLVTPPLLDAQGFQRVESVSALADLEDQAQVVQFYYAEADALLRKSTGAVKTVILDHTLRIDEPGREAIGLREPVRYGITSNRTLGHPPGTRPSSGGGSRAASAKTLRNHQPLAPDRRSDLHHPAGVVRCQKP